MVYILTLPRIHVLLFVVMWELQYAFASEQNHLQTECIMVSGFCPCYPYEWSIAVYTKQGTTTNVNIIVNNTVCKKRSLVLVPMPAASIQATERYLLCNLRKSFSLRVFGCRSSPTGAVILTLIGNPVKSLLKPKRGFTTADDPKREISWRTRERSKSCLIAANDPRSRVPWQVASETRNNQR